MEKSIIENIRKGNINAFEHLFNQYYLKVRNFAFGFVKQMDMAENIAQNVFMKIWIGRENLVPDKSIDSYIFTIVRNEISDSFRNRGYTIRYLEHAGMMMSGKYEIDSEYNVKEIKEIVRETVDAMPEQRRLVFRMSRWQFLSNDEIAVRLGISKRTVEKHISLALAEIRRKLGEFLFFLFIFLIS